MKDAILLPPNQYVEVFDFALQFNLALGKILIDIHPSIIHDASGVKGFAAEITHHQGVILQDQLIIFPENLNAVYPVILPTIHKTPLWGVYTITGTLFMTAGEEYKIQKSFNLCPPVEDDIYASGMKGDLMLSVDCADGIFFVNDFACRLYRGTLPSKVTYNLTHFFPKESGVVPQRNITQIPYYSAAYNGLNRVAGNNHSEFSFHSNISVVIRVAGEAEKQVRCVPDYNSIYCGLRKMFDDLVECRATPQQMAASLNEIELLLWSITVGSKKGRDVSDDIVRLEELVGISCTCHGCPGERVGTAPGCAVIKSPAASNTGGNIIVTFNGEDVPAGSFLRVSYRPLCRDGNAPYTDVVPDYVLTGAAIQGTDFKVKYGGVYQLKLTTIVDGRICGTVNTDTGNYGVCPVIVDINKTASSTGVNPQMRRRK